MPVEAELFEQDDIRRAVRVHDRTLISSDGSLRRLPKSLGRRIFAGICKILEAVCCGFAARRRAHSDEDQRGDVMATYTWSASGGGDFNVASNWTLDWHHSDHRARPQRYCRLQQRKHGHDLGQSRCLPDLSSTTTPPTGRSPARARSLPSTFHGALTLASGASITASGGLGLAPDPGSSGTLWSNLAPATTGPPRPRAPIICSISAMALAQPEPRSSKAQGRWQTPGPMGERRPESDQHRLVADPGRWGGEVRDVRPFHLASLSVDGQGTGTVTVDGTGSQLQLSGYVAAGRTGTGTVTLTNGASLTETAVPNDLVSFFGNGIISGGVALTGGTGFLNVLSGSTATFGDSLGFGENGDTGMGLVLGRDAEGGGHVGGRCRHGDAWRERHSDHRSWRRCSRYCGGDPSTAVRPAGRDGWHHRNRQRRWLGITSGRESERDRCRRNRHGHADRLGRRPDHLHRADGRRPRRRHAGPDEWSGGNRQVSFGAPGRR